MSIFVVLIAVPGLSVLLHGLKFIHSSKLMKKAKSTRESNKLLFVPKYLRVLIFPWTRNVRLL